MAAVSKLEVTAVFEDGDTSKVVIDNIDPTVFNGTKIEHIRTQVQTFNNADGGELATKMKSKNGFNWIGIKKVQIVTTDKTVLF